MADELKIGSADDNTDRLRSSTRRSPDNNNDDYRTDPSDSGADEIKQNKIIPLLKPIVVNPDVGKSVDSRIIANPYYNSFNYSLLANGFENLKFTFGITSPNRSDGKTLVACNFGVSLALGYQKKTALVDLNIVQPRLHKVFGTTLSPGLVDSFQNHVIHISRTRIENLFVLSAGNQKKAALGVHRVAQSPLPTEATAVKPLIRLEQMAAFRDVLYSLGQEFDFVIVDMPAVNSPGFSSLFANQLNGVIVVIDARKTKRDDIEKMFRQLNERQVQGFVFNRVNDDSY